MVPHKTNLNELKNTEAYRVYSLTINQIKLEISNRKITEKSLNTWKLNNTFLKNIMDQRGISKINFNIKKLSKNENTCQTSWDTTEAVPREKLIALNAYTRKQGRSQMSNITSYLKKLEKERKINPKQEQGMGNKEKNKNKWNWK